jgi:hypothetical protein
MARIYYKCILKSPYWLHRSKRYSIGVTPYRFGYPTPDDAEMIRSIDGSPIAHIQLLTKNFLFSCNA